MHSNQLTKRSNNIRNLIYLIDNSAVGYKGIGRYAESIISSMKRIDGLIVKERQIVGKKNVFSWRSLLKIVTKENWDVYVSPHMMIPICMLTSRKKIFMTIHDIIPFKYDLRFKFKILEVYIKLTKIFNVEYLAPSQYSKERIVSYFDISEEKVHVVNNCLPSRILEQALVEERRNSYEVDQGKVLNILYIGNLKVHKNIDVLLDACRLNADKDKRTKITLVAGNKPKRDIQSKLNYEDLDINIIGNITDSELIKLIGESTVLIQPSIEEGFGIPILESIITGTPVVCSNIPVFRELYENYVTFFNPYDAQELAAILRKESWKVNKISKRRTIAEKYSQENQVQQIKRIICQ